MELFEYEIAGISLMEWIGYTASLFILIGMTMSSVRKLRWINLGGNVLFTLYGVLIGSMPVAVMNALIGVVNLSFLWSLYRRKETFRLLPVQISNRYLAAFIEFHKADIQQFFPGFYLDPDRHNRAYIVLRDMTVAAVIVGSATHEGELFIELDYAVAAYRDMKPGFYVYGKKEGGLVSEGYNCLSSVPGSKAHQRYLGKCGFSPVANQPIWRRQLS